MLIWIVIHRLALAVIAALLFGYLLKHLNTWPAIGLWALIACLVCLLGTVLLRTSAIGRITWKNRIAGYLIPWGGTVNQGRLWPIPVVSWLVWMLIAIAVAILSLRWPETVEHSADRIWLIFLFTSWLVDGGAILYLLGVLVKNAPNGSKAKQSLTRILIALVLLIGASLFAFSFGQLTIAVLIAGGPPGMAGIAFGLFFGMLLTLGRNARWN